MFKAFFTQGKGITITVSQDERLDKTGQRVRNFKDSSSPRTEAGIKSMDSDSCSSDSEKRNLHRQNASFSYNSSTLPEY